jgi:hypothetical protein
MIWVSFFKEVIIDCRIANLDLLKDLAGIKDIGPYQLLQATIPFICSN